MKEILVRFFAGGITVSVFAVLGDIFKPKSFAGLFGSAPSVALATLALTLGVEGRAYASTEALSMSAGAVAFLIYATAVSWAMMRLKLRALAATVLLLPLWLAVALGFWFFVLR